MKWSNGQKSWESWSQKGDKRPDRLIQKYHTELRRASAAATSPAAARQLLKFRSLSATFSSDSDDEPLSKRVAVRTSVAASASGSMPAQRVQAAAASAALPRAAASPGPAERVPTVAAPAVPRVAASPGPAAIPPLDFSGLVKQAVKCKSATDVFIRKAAEALLLDLNQLPRTPAAVATSERQMREFLFHVHGVGVAAANRS